MAIVDADWSFDNATGNIRYIGDDHNGAAPSYATVIELHRWLQDLADDAVFSGDDELDITVENPSSRSTDNIITLIGSANIDDASSEHLYDGSIIQASGAEIYDGIVNFGNPQVQIQVHQDGAVLADDWWNKSIGGTHDGAADAAILTDSGESWTTDQFVDYTIYNVTDGSSGIITANTATTITATLAGGTDDDWDIGDAYVIGIPLNADANQGISHRFMLKVRTGGSDTDGRRLLGTSRRFGKTYSEFSINGTSRGNNVLALNDADDLNNATAEATVAGWTTIVNQTEGYVGLDVDGDGSNEFYYSEWDRAALSINSLYERTKYLSRDGSGSTLYGLSGELFRGITHEIDVDTPTGTFAAVEAVSWTGGTGQLLAIDSTTAPTKMWIQLLTGTAPSNTDTITGAGGGTADCSGTPTARTPVPQPFLGQSTGGAIIGGYGAGIRAADLTFPDKLTDLGNTLREAPNNVTFTVEGLEIGDRVLVTQYDAVATDIDKDQYALSGPVNGAAVGTITVQTAIQSDTPQSGIALRVVNDEGYDVYLPVASWTGSTFTLTSTYDFSGTGENDSAANGNNVYVGYIDKDATATSESFTVVYTADRSLFVRVRDGAEPIRTFETTASLTSTGGSATAIRTADA